MKRHTPRMAKALIILLGLILVISLEFAIGGPVASAETPPPSADSSANGLGITPFSPNRVFGDDEFINAENGNLHKLMTDVTLPGRGIPLRITRVYNSQWNRPIYTGSLRVTDDSDHRTWNGRDYANDDPNYRRPVGFEITYATFELSKKSAFEYLQGLAFGAGGGFFLGVTLQAAVIGWAIGVVVDLLQGDTAYWATTLLLSAPKQELGVNEVYAIVDNNDHNNRTIAVSADASAPTHPRSKIKVILNDGSMIPFNARGYFGFFSAPSSGQEPLLYDSVDDLSNYRVMYDYQLGKYVVTTPSGVSYYLEPHRDEIKNNGLPGDWFSTKYERVDLLYALPTLIQDAEGHRIEIRRSPAPPYRITSIVDTLGREIAIRREGNVETLNLPGDRKIVYTYDGDNNITSVKDPEGRVTTYSYLYEGVKPQNGVVQFSRFKRWVWGSLRHP